MEFIWSLNFSLARRDQHTKTLWKYPSHPLFDSANRRGVACIFITPERSASNEPHEYVFCAKQIECAARCLHTRCRPSPYCTYACSSGAFDQCMLAPDWLAQSQSWYVTQPSLAPCSEYMHTYRPYAYDVTEGRPRGVGGQTRHATCTIAKHALRGQTPACLTAELARVRTLTERVSANALCQQNMCAQRDKS